MCIIRPGIYATGMRVVCPGNRQEEPRDTGATLSSSGSICCLHPAAFVISFLCRAIRPIGLKKVLAKIVKRERRALFGTAGRRVVKRAGNRARVITVLAAVGAVGSMNEPSEGQWEEKVVVRCRLKRRVSECRGR